MNYKDTLNLPKTTFSMKANLANLEPRINSLWQDMNIYQKLKKARKDSEKFILHDGPPYANGLIHIGHALNKILKDVIIKYKGLRGYNCPYIAGWDCHGLPVEHQLFKELKLTKHDVEISDFRKKARDYALKFVELQREDFKRLGLFSDWENPYLTLDPEYERGVIELLGYLCSKGYIYRGRKPVNWCGVCETALAEAEVEYTDKTSESIYFLFDVADDKGIFGGQDTKIHFLVWTTTPWTVVSNVAVALNPNLEYCLAGFGDRKIVIAKDLMPKLKEYLKTDFDIFKSFMGSNLEGMVLNHPFLKRKSAVVLADFVSHEDGSGCVHIAPGHGAEDFSLVKKYDLDIIMPVNDKGVFDEPDEFKGKNVAQVNELVIAKLKENKALIEHQKIRHSYPHCWRCKQPIIFRATFQWFLNVDHDDLRKKLLDETEKVTWVPSSGKERMKGMLVGRPDWCLSRQRLWGIPIPAIKCKKCGKVSLTPEVAAKASEVFAKKGSDSWFDSQLNEFLPEGFSCSCGSSDLEKEFDILDVWFESGASFHSVVKNNPQLNFPADLYLEGSDQHRGWFQVSLIPSVAKEKKAPFKAILTHGFVVDGEGRKMSKSLGNVIAPQKITKQYGAEILRLWAAFTDYSEDVKISQEIIKQLVDMYRKVRNTIRFILGNISDFNPRDKKVSFSDLLEVDKFMLAKLAKLSKNVISSYEEFSFYKVCQKIFNFCNLDLSSFYLDILKDRLYTFHPESHQRRSAQFALYHILEELLKLIAPILSFTAEEAYLSWENLKPKKDSIFLEVLDEEEIEPYSSDELLQNWDKILALRTQVLKEIEKKREDGVIGSSLEAEVHLVLDEKKYEFFEKYREALKEVFIVSTVKIEKGEFQITVEKAKGDKCLRCWMWSSDVGRNDKHPNICNKCVQALKEARL